MADDVEAVMATIPAEWRTHWCGGEYGPCWCMGCVQVGNRLVMVGLRASQVDPEYIDETRIDPETYRKYKITHAEWLAWMREQGPR